jgi:O-antigen/teichoic acid export membrane protein
VLLAGAVASADNLSDIYYGALQRRERMDLIALSTIARGLVSLTGMGLALWLTGSLLTAMAAQAIGRIAVLLAFDHWQGTAGESLKRTSLREQAAILRTALPLGIVLLLVSLTTNLPRYSIERHIGLAELGAFAAAASFLTAGSTVVNALGQAATPRLARYFGEGDRSAFHRLTLELVAVALLLGLAGLAGAAVLGEWLLRLAYRPAYGAYAGLLLWIMGAATLNYLAGTLGYVVTSMRAFAVQAPLFAAVAATSGIMSAVWIPMVGVKGAAWALAAAWLVQIAGELWILRKGLAA